jgi:hypothetical protein
MVRLGEGRIGRGELEGVAVRTLGAVAPSLFHSWGFGIYSI